VKLSDNFVNEYFFDNQVPALIHAANRVELLYKMFGTRVSVGFGS